MRASKWETPLGRSSEVLDDGHHARLADFAQLRHEQPGEIRRQDVVHVPSEELLGRQQQRRQVARVVVQVHAVAAHHEHEVGHRGKDRLVARLALDELVFHALLVGDVEDDALADLAVPVDVARGRADVTPAQLAVEAPDAHDDVERHRLGERALHRREEALAVSFDHDVQHHGRLGEQRFCGQAEDLDDPLAEIREAHPAVGVMEHPVEEGLRQLVADRAKQVLAIGRREEAVLDGLGLRLVHGSAIVATMALRVKWRAGRADRFGAAARLRGGKGRTGPSADPRLPPRRRRQGWPPWSRNRGRSRRRGS